MYSLLVTTIKVWKELVKRQSLTGISQKTLFHKHLNSGRCHKGLVSSHVSAGSFLYIKEKAKEKKRTSPNAHTIHIHYIYVTSLQSFPSQWTIAKVWLLHATLQQDNCTSSCFLIPLLPWVKIKITQIGIKMQSLVMFIIIPSLKQISSQASERKPKL